MSNWAIHNFKTCTQQQYKCFIIICMLFDEKWNSGKSNLLVGKNTCSVNKTLTDRELFTNVDM